MILKREKNIWHKQVNIIFTDKWCKMKSLVIASNNKHKKEEIEALLNNSIQLLTPKEIGCFDELPETDNTLEGNARQKAMYVYEKFGYDCFADDTGLEVEALHGAPGVYSARYSADEAPNIDEKYRSEYNIEKLLRELKNNGNRKARFRTVICFIEKGKPVYFEGIVNGIIIDEKKGIDGFGYDPVFLPDGYAETFAEMDMATKNAISHRGRAVVKLIEYLDNAK